MEQEVVEVVEPKKKKWKNLKYAESYEETLDKMSLEILTILEQNMETIYFKKHIIDEKRNNQARQRLLCLIITKLLGYYNDKKTLLTTLLDKEIKRVEEIKALNEKERKKKLKP